MKLNKLKQSLLLSGRPGLSMREDAEHAASEYLDVKKLERHPDYLCIETPKDKKSIGVEDIMPLLNRAYLRPSIAPKTVCIVDGIDRFTVQAQNKVLKVLEDCQSMIILAISYSDNVLATVKSRLVPVTYHPLLFEEFISKISGEYSDSDKMLLFEITKGCPGLVEDVKELLSVFEAVQIAIQTKSPQGMFPAFNLVKEKDKEAITGTPFIPLVVAFLNTCYTELLIANSTNGKSAYMMENHSYTMDELTRICKLTAEHNSIVNKQSYSKDNFVLLLMKIVSCCRE